MSINKGLYSSDKEDWNTPDDLFDILNREFEFTLDVCANEANAKCEYYFDEETDCTQHSWGGNRCFMNPPYGKKIGRCMQKAYEEYTKGVLTVCLVPSRTDTKWWHNWAMCATEIRFVEGRVRFKGAESGAPFPSAIVIYNPEQTGLIVKSWKYK